MWKICENQKIVEKFGAEISGLIGRENRCCNQLRSKCKNHGGKWCKMVKNQYKNPCKNRKKTVHLFVKNKQYNKYQNWQNIGKETAKIGKIISGKICGKSSKTISGKKRQMCRQERRKHCQRNWQKDWWKNQQIIATTTVGKSAKKRWINRHLSTLSTLSVSTLSLATSSLSTLSLSALSLSTLSLSVVSTLSLSTLSTLPAHRVHGIWKVGTLQVRQPYQAFNCCKL